MLSSGLFCLYPAERQANAQAQCHSPHSRMLGKSLHHLPWIFLFISTKAKHNSTQSSRATKLFQSYTRFLDFAFSITFTATVEECSRKSHEIDLSFLKFLKGFRKQRYQDFVTKERFIFGRIYQIFVRPSV